MTPPGADRAASLFMESFGHEPAVVASAPGRVNLIGEHTDYNGGQVLPIAIAQRTWVAMKAREGDASRAVSDRLPSGTFRIADGCASGNWWDYIHGTLREVVALGSHLSAVDAAVISDVPMGAGLSSSAALEIATALAGVVAEGGRILDFWDDFAPAAHRAESNFVGVECGTMDQTASTYAAAGHALRVWCDSGKREHVRFNRSVLVVDTAIPRELRSSEFNQRRAACNTALTLLRKSKPGLTSLAELDPEQDELAQLPELLRRRVRHVVTENERVERFVGALEKGESLGHILLESHESLRADYECSVPELDWVVEAAMAFTGVEGARLTGAGWGGCAIVLGSEDALVSLREPLLRRYEERWKRAPRAWLTCAEDGADIDLARERSRMSDRGL